MNDLDGQPKDNDWASQIEKQGTVVLDCDQHVLVVDACCPWSAVVADYGEPAVLDRLKTQTARISRIPHPRTEIWYVGPWPASTSAIASIRALAARTAATSNIIRVYFADNADLVRGLTEFAGPRGRCSLVLFGKTPELSEDCVSELVRRGASVNEAVGWPIETQPPDFERISRLSELGLSLPVTVYVHRNNLAKAIDVADQCLHANYNAGIAFEAACAHPLFTEAYSDLLPDADAYCELLVNAYNRFQHYDKVFEPIASLIANLRFGGFDASSGVSLLASYRVDAAGAVRRFRRLPWPALHTEPVPNESDFSLAAACSACRWNTMCGGCEDTKADVFELTCRYRMLFLEFFVREMHHKIVPASENQDA